MKSAFHLLTVLLTPFLVHCSSMDTGFQGYTALPVLLGSQDGLSVSASAAATGANHGKLRLIKESVMESTHGDFYTGKSLTLVTLMAKMSEAFADAADAAPGTTVYTLGSLSAGGEARFHATGDGGIQIEYLGNSTGTITFNRKDVGTFKSLLDQARAQSGR